MRYLIAHLIKGAAKEYHVRLSDRLASQYRLEPVSARIDPHITLNAPFDTDDISAVEYKLEAFARKETPQPLTLGGIGHFRHTVLFMNISAPVQTHMLVRRLQDQLRQIPWLPFKRTEFSVTLHATICYPRHPQQGKEILDSLFDEKPAFDLQLENIALLRKPGTKWETYREFTIKP